jgi:hypothetical protein
MTDRLLQVGRHYGMETNVEKTMAMRIKNKPTQYTLEQKQLESVEHFNCLGSMKTNDARCTCEIKSRITMAKTAFNK